MFINNENICIYHLHSDLVDILVHYINPSSLNEVVGLCIKYASVNNVHDVTNLLCSVFEHNEVIRKESMRYYDDNEIVRFVFIYDIVVDLLIHLKGMIGSTFTKYLLDGGNINVLVNLDIKQLHIRRIDERVSLFTRT